MSRIIHARLDEETEKMLQVLQRRLGWTDSRVVREGIKSLNGLVVRRTRQRIRGIGKFRSGIADLGSNKKHLQGFGQ